MTPTAVSDAELLGQARDGDEAAFTELYVRHQAAAQRLANAYARAGDPEDLVNESFERVLAALRRGSGPTEAFRAYLFVTLRRLAADRIARMHDEPVEEVPEPVRAEAQTAELDPTDRQLVVAAYESLPDRWQAVLWQTAVEGRQPRDLAPALGMTANAAAALAYRAREKLRQAYLQAHLQAAPRPQCEPHRSRLGAYVRDGLSRRDRTGTESHLDDCGSCRGLVGELADVNRMLVRSITPLFAATATQIAAATVGATAGGTGGNGASAVARRLANKARSNPAVVAGVVLVAALAFALISSQGGDNSALPEAERPRAENDREVDSPEPPDTPDRPDSSDPADPPAAPGEEPPQQLVPIVALAPTTTAPPGSPGSPVTTAPPGTPPGTPPPSAPPDTPGQPTPTTTVPTTGPPTSPPPPTGTPYLLVVWLDDVAELRITLHNPTSQPTSPLVLNVELSSGASTRARPTGCGLLTTLLSGASCGLSPVAPGQSATVAVGLDVTGSGPTARVSACEARLLSLNCDGGLLGSLVTLLI